MSEFTTSASFSGYQVFPVCNVGSSLALDALASALLAGLKNRLIVIFCHVVFMLCFCIFV